MFPFFWFSFFERPQPAVEVITPSVIAERRRQSEENAALARSIAEVIESRGLDCDGQTALRMFASHLSASWR
jgi:hypothetical protein